jgi:hypothetical protein
MHPGAMAEGGNHVVAGGGVADTDQPALPGGREVFAVG